MPDHHLIRVIGRGAYGEVWLAQSALHTYRAVKILFRKQFDNQQPYEREFNGIKKFEPVSRTHQGLVDVLQIGRNDTLGYFYYVMELADNATEEQEGFSSGARPGGTSIELASQERRDYSPKTLRSELRSRGNLPVEECIRIGLALTSALEDLHRAELVHRDIKPSNIIFVNGVPKLADIGLVAEVGEAKSLVGTPGYIAPEGPGTPQADLYSLGKVFYEMSTGREQADFPRLPDNLRELTHTDSLVEFNDIVLKACVQDPRKRYQSALEMGRDLQLLAAGGSVKRESKREKRWKRIRKTGWLVLLALSAGAVLFGLCQARYELESADAYVVNHTKWGDEIRLDSSPERLAIAVDHYRRAIAKDPKFIPARIGLFRARLLQVGGFRERPPDAISNLCAAAEALMKVAPDLAEGQIAASCIASMNGRAAEALARARRAISLRPASKEGGAFVHQMYGSCLLRNCLYEQAFTELSLAEKENTANPTLQLQLGNWYFAQGHFDKALEHFTRSIEMRPDQYWPYWCKGKCYEEKENFTEALKWFEVAELRSGKNETETKAWSDQLRRAFMTGGRDGYWQARLGQESGKSKPAARSIAVCLAHLHREPESYKSLESACKGGNLDGLWFEPCWNRKDPRFQTLAKQFLSSP